MRIGKILMVLGLALGAQACLTETDRLIMYEVFHDDGTKTRNIAAKPEAASPENKSVVQDLIPTESKDEATKAADAKSTDAITEDKETL